jgi:proteasome beta subunit
MPIRLDHSDPSFLGLLKRHHPELVPRIDSLPPGAVAAASATTIVALTYKDGVLIAADRRATLGGHLIMSEDVVKVFKTDEQSAIAIAGTFGPAVKMAKLFKTELEHYEKIERVPLSLEGRANKLSQMIEMNFPAAIQGLPVMPIYAGFDCEQGRGVIFEYDITGGTFIKPHSEPYAASGSGGDRARATFEHFYKGNMTQAEALKLVIRSLGFAAEKDTATGGKRFIVMNITAEGVKDISAGEEG